MNIPGLISIIVFYLLILAVGIWAARKKKNIDDNGNLSDSELQDEVILAGRSIGCFVGTFTMTGIYIII